VSHGPRDLLSSEQVANIVFNETRSLSGLGIDTGRGEIAGSIINADEYWGPDRGRNAGTAPEFLGKRGLSPSELETYDSILAIVEDVRIGRALGYDLVMGATNFNMRPYWSEAAPFWNRTLQSQSITGPFGNTIGAPMFIHIWLDPATRRVRSGH